MKTRIIAFLLLVMITGTTVYASDVSGAVYQATVRITNSSTETTNVAVPFTLNSQYLLDNSFVNSSFNNTAMVGVGGSDVAYMPGSNSTNPWIVYVSSIGENSQINNMLYMGGDDMAAKLSYFPGSGGMTTSDAASLELGDNFTITLSDVFIDTTAGSGKYILYKTDSIYLYIDESTSGTINLLIKDAESTGTVYLRPNAAGDLTQIQHETANPHYEQVDESSPDDDTTKVYQNDEDGTATDLYHLSAPNFSGDGQDTFTVTHYYRAREDSGGFAGYGYAEVKLGSSTFEGSQDSHTTSYANYSETVTRPGGGTWVSSDFDDIQAGMKIYAVAGGADHVTQVYLKVDYTYWDQTEVSVSGIVSGEYDITISADGTNLSLDVGGSSDSVALGGISVADTANDIISFENDTVLYAGSQEIEVDGVQIQYVDWDYGTTFEDQSGNSNDATPTFRTTSSDADVSAEMLDFEPYDPADIGEYSIEEESYMIDDAPDEPDDLYDTVNESALDIPDTMLPGLFNPLLDNATIPRSFFWIFVAFCTAMAGGLLAYGGVTKLKGESVSFAAADSFALFIQALVSGLILVIWIVATGGSVIPAWIMAPYVIIELAAILLVRRGVA